MTAQPYRLAPLEVATGLVLGGDPPATLTLTDCGRSPREELERDILVALQRPPCLVSFSGGRDSSAVLALAAHVARREGLPLPIPATNRFAGVESADETEWQELVVSHLGLDEWERLEHGADLDCVGPVAGELLLRHGLLWPFNVHFHVPLLRIASGGSLLTGIGGDELLSPSPYTEAGILLRRHRLPRPRDVRRIAFTLAPARVRRPFLRRRLPLAFSWLQPAAAAAVRSTWAAHTATEPPRWAAHVGWTRRQRYLRVGTASLDVAARDEGVDLRHPFLAPGFAGALAALPRGRRPRHRTAAMRDLLADLLPDELLARATKSGFDPAFWSDHARALAASWDASGVDDEVVDTEALRAEWSSEAPDPRTFTLAQSVWLADRSGDRVEQALSGVR